MYVDTQPTTTPQKMCCKANPTQCKNHFFMPPTVSVTSSPAEAFDETFHSDATNGLEPPVSAMLWLMVESMGLWCTGVDGGVGELGSIIGAATISMAITSNARARARFRASSPLCSSINGALLLTLLLTLCLRLRAPKSIVAKTPTAKTLTAATV